MCNNITYSLNTPDGPKEIEYRNAINEITRNAYSKDCLIGIKRWNNLIRKSGFNFEFKLPSTKYLGVLLVFGKVLTLALVETKLIRVYMLK